MKTTITRRLAAILSAAAILSGSSRLSHAQEPDMDDYLPVEHTMTDATGRKIAATILSKTDTVIKFRRTSDGKEFEMPIENLSPTDQEFFKLLGKPGPIEKSELNLSVSGSPIKVTRLGNGPIGVVFFGYTGSGSMMKYITSNPQAFTGLLPAKTSFFLWEYPRTGVFREVDPAIEAYLDGDKAKLRPNFTGVASEILTQIREKTGLKEFLLIGNSLGAGIVLWDYKTISTDPKVSFLLISPTEAFMPPVSELGKLERTMLLAAHQKTSSIDQRNPDVYLVGTEALDWVTSNLDVDAIDKITTGVIEQFVNRWKTNRLETHGTQRADFSRGHKIIGHDIDNVLLSKIIKVKLGMKPSTILAIRATPYSLQSPYDVSYSQSRMPVTPLKAKNVVMIKIPSGETAIIELETVGNYTESGQNLATYRWKYRSAPSQPVQTGEGRVIESFNKINKEGSVTSYDTMKETDCTIRAGGITVEWTLGNMLRHDPSRATLTILPAGSFNNDF